MNGEGKTMHKNEQQADQLLEKMNSQHDHDAQRILVECVGCTGGDAAESREFMSIHHGEYGWTLRCHNCMMEVKVHGNDSEG